MRSITSYVDDRLMSAEFGTGDVVRKTGLRDFVLTPYSGRVLYSNTETGKVYVQWPWGVEQESSTELVRFQSSDMIPPELADQSYSSWEGERHKDGKERAKSDEKWRKSLSSKIVESYESITLPLYRAACEAWHCGMSEIDTFVQMSSSFGEEYGQDAIRLTVSNLYESGRHLAIYWKDNKRRYKTTQQEKNSNKFGCPRCKGILKPRVYRQGRRILLCKTCGFSIHPRDLLI